MRCFNEKPIQSGMQKSCRQRRLGLTAVICGFILSAPLSSPAWAEEAKSSILESWFEQDYATGDWGGARTDLSNDGFTPALNYTTDLMANPSGGMNQSGAYAAGWTGSLDFDLEKLAGIKGLSFFAAGSLQQGRDLSGDDIGNIFAVAQVFNGDVWRLNQLYFEQSLWQDDVNIAIGRLAAGDDFATSDSYGYYVSGAVNGNPTGILANIPSFTTPPFAQWGARVTVQPTSDIYISGGAYNADPSVQDDDQHGIDFKFNPDDGVLGLAEIGYSLNQGDKDPGLPGQYSFGAYYDSSDFARLDDPTAEENGNYGLYAIGQQMVYREGKAGSDQGLTLWGTLTTGPDQSINTLPFAAFGGAYYQGLIPERDNDVTAVAAYYGLFSDDLPGQSYELALEVNHRFQLAPWLYLTPDFQYIINPNGGGIDDAAVVGIEISIDF
ncbi:MAG: carbohydrate porin [Pseudomonadota bacterium]